MKVPRRQLPAAKAIEELLEGAYPGKSAAVQRLRRDILSFAESPTARVLFLAGPSGAGKSTVARHVAYVKAYGIIDAEKPDELRPEHLRYAGPNLLDHKMMTEWYVELPLTGLIESIAESQLFGVAKGAFTGAVPRPGVFELASRDEKSFGVKVTGGVVFLDEVGELSEALQGKLLPVLSNGAFYRVGGEGSSAHLVQYRGIVISASWRKITHVLRPDLAARLTSRVIHVPGLDEREEDLPDLIRAAATKVIDRFQYELERLKKLEVEPAVARGHFDEIAKALVMPDESDLKRLCAIKWAKHGQFRGLTNALDQIIVERRDAAEVLASLPRFDEPSRPTGLSDALLMLAGGGRSLTGLADSVRTIEAQGREQLRVRIADDMDFSRRLAKRLGISERELRKQAMNLTRDRRTRT